MNRTEELLELRKHYTKIKSNLEAEIKNLECKKDQVFCVNNMLQEIDNKIKSLNDEFII